MYLRAKYRLMQLENKPEVFVHLYQDIPEFYSF